MQTEIHTFRDWGYPFITKDYEAECGKDCREKMLGGIVAEPGDKLIEDIVYVAIGYIRDDIPAVMVELEHVWDTPLAHDIKTYLDKLFYDCGYKDLESYEHRLSYGKF